MKYKATLKKAAAAKNAAMEAATSGEAEEALFTPWDEQWKCLNWLDKESVERIFEVSKSLPTVVGFLERNF